MANPFAGPEVAARYHAGRPRHHERTLRRVGLAGPGVALDVAGGTGLSTEALIALGFDAVCVDLSVPMLSMASQPKLAARAELLPVATGCADVITVSSGVHWFDQPAFYAEARRVLGDGGRLVLYEHGFAGIADHAELAAWAADVYRARYPTPPRGGYPGETDVVGFERVIRDAFSEDIPMRQRELVDYFLTQSNTIGPVERGDETLEQVRAWLEGETTPFFAAADEGVLSVTFWAAVEVWR